MSAARNRLVHLLQHRIELAEGSAFSALIGPLFSQHERLPQSDTPSHRIGFLIHFALTCFQARLTSPATAFYCSPALPADNCDMIDLTRLNGHRLVINCDLIKCAEASPDTTLSLVTGEKVIVREPLDHLIALITAYRASILKATWPEAANALAALASIAALPCDGPLHRRDDL